MLKRANPILTTAEGTQEPDCHRATISNSSLSRTKICASVSGGHKSQDLDRGQDALFVVHRACKLLFLGDLERICAVQNKACISFIFYDIEVAVKSTCRPSGGCCFRGHPNLQIVSFCRPAGLRSSARPIPCTELIVRAGRRGTPPYITSSLPSPSSAPHLYSAGHCVHAATW